MDSGTIYIHGTAGDAVAHSMRGGGGEVYVRDSIGYRGGIHMKEYKDKCPVVVVGAYARAFLGEYMAGGGVLIVLGRGGISHRLMNGGVGTGIHGGEIYIRGGEVPDHLLGIGAEKKPFTEKDREKIRPYIEKYCQEFGWMSRNSSVTTTYISGRPVPGRLQANTAGSEKMANTYLNLKEEVWDKGICSGCGACVAVCPADAILFTHDEDNSSPVQTGYCKEVTDSVPAGRVTRSAREPRQKRRTG